MSWTESCTETNEFKVKDSEEVKRVFERMGFYAHLNKELNTLYAIGEEDYYFCDTAEVVLSLEPIETETGLTNLVGVTTDCLEGEVEDMLLDHNLKMEDVMVVPIIEYLQDELVEGHAIVITSAGFEGRSGGNSCPFGDTYFITKNHVEFYSLTDYINNKAKEFGVEV